MGVMGEGANVGDLPYGKKYSILGSLSNQFLSPYEDIISPCVFFY